jgi:TonB family protein
MFNVVVEHRRRRVWTPRTVAVSVAAHLLVLAGVVTAAANVTPPEHVIEIPIGPPPEPRAPQPVKPTAPRPIDRPPPVRGHTLVLQAPTTVPTRVLPPDPTATPTDPNAYSGEGPIGDSVGTPSPGPPQTPAAGPGPLTDFRVDAPVDAGLVDQLPQLASPREAQRLLERAYPPLLRDAGVAGHTTVVLVIDRNGVVQPGSVSVRETTNDAFREAAVRAAERFRFRPAKLNGQPVPVIISIPIEWQIGQ